MSKFFEKTCNYIADDCKNWTRAAESWHRNFEKDLNMVRDLHNSIEKLEKEVEDYIKNQETRPVNSKNDKKLEEKTKQLNSKSSSLAEKKEKLIKDRNFKNKRNSESFQKLKNGLNSMRGNQLDVFWEIMRVFLFHTANIKAIEAKYDAAFPPVTDYSAGTVVNPILEEEPNGSISSDSLEPPESLSITPAVPIDKDEKFMNDNLTENMTGMLARIQEACSAVTAWIAPTAVPSTCGQETENVASEINNKFTAQTEIDKKKLEEKTMKDKIDNEKEQLALVHHNRQKLAIQTNGEEEWKKIFEGGQKKSETYLHRLEEQRRENEQKIREKREERESYQQETKRREEEAFIRFQQVTDTVIQCLILKLSFDVKEKEWSDWLQMLQKTIAGAKMQFSNFENTMVYETSRSEMEYELNNLHCSTFSAYSIMYKAWQVAKQYSEVHEDKIFLKLLMVNFVSICDKFFNILESIDNFEYSSCADPVRAIREAYSSVNGFDVHTTTKLRSILARAKPESYSNIPEPRFYQNNLL
ncbi:hypothetical protein GCK72_008087 [Caenorhabditis remanei]|uniref:Uncharacterized protein n=1 Tax=Caenorhabditis remanei TaxID=31234 RepID=A0A6A5HKR9_CAERE|nr:hypothetical protein GCK72_008087 [Caenorhabditis remanei]KAF1768125.1 hypothetical protein GCK72_008087 [Caenorhabditis remanei]